MPNMIIASMSDRSPVDLGGVMKDGELQRRKFRLQPVAIHLGVNVDDEDFAGHAEGGRIGAAVKAFARPKCRIALLNAISSRTVSDSGV